MRATYVENQTSSQNSDSMNKKEIAIILFIIEFYLQDLQVQNI